MNKILITGGAGFIGSKVCEILLKQGKEVVVLDSLSPQVHPNQQPSTDFKNILPYLTFIKADICDRNALKKALANVSGVIHLAAETGTGQSMYEIEKYIRVNDYGTALLLDEIACHDLVEAVVVASSRAVYGEGKYLCDEHGIIYPKDRNADRLSKGDFDFYCPKCKNKLTVTGTDEETPINPKSVYGLTKYCQESLTLQCGKITGKRTTALRYQNVYGPGQSLSNPYTGIFAIFSTRLRHGKEVFIFEDGLESRDFVYIYDAAQATIMALEEPKIDQQVINVGYGKSTSIIEVINKLRKRIAPQVKISITGEYRIGDIRHNYADMHKAENLLGFQAKVDFDTGLHNFVDWTLTSKPATDLYQQSLTKLRKKGLLVK